ncbi:helix-turn-helix domain-containing protein [Phytoactinopolyspora halotolerans]|uniref:Helix-turn-helix domain-containing protein n=1 Tax=Phytoactinopolyspora halotolerans TaxID=1981512 RepID=A0A6L9SEY6_9ACTN|nr:helix-turn-helix domain-containing protein [Phytoactinopolyspora halotolerans]NEE03061.1 helix-turn-helix domain-containing protein [Phytoactinopolyspora halotolerans]
MQVLNTVDEHPEWNHTVISLAQHGAVSVRTLELRFRQYLDTTPSRFVIEARLDRIHDLLVQGSPDTTTVEEVATGLWYSSFGHLIRHYVRRFGEQPMDTLSRMGSARDGGASDDRAGAVVATAAGESADTSVDESADTSVGDGEHDARN